MRSSGVKVVLVMASVLGLVSVLPAAPARLGYLSSGGIDEAAQAFVEHRVVAHAVWAGVIS
jgi:hypothetical protein